MSAGVGGGGAPGRGGRGGSQDFELNLASIIDCFTVLIAFMLASSSFLAIGILDAGIAAAGATPASNQPPTVQVSVELKQGKDIVVKLSGKANATYTVSAAGQGKNEWNYEALGSRLAEIKGKYSDAQAVTLLADNSVEYKDVIKAMEATRKQIPAVMLGGF